MFHKNMSKGVAYLGWSSLTLIFLCLSGCPVYALAQDFSTVPPEAQEKEGDARDKSQANETEQGGYRTLDILKTGQSSTGEEAQSDRGIPVPIQEEKSLGAQEYVDDVFLSTRNHWGFSVSAHQGYTSALYEEGRPSQSSGITAFTPRAFFNFGRRKSQFHIDLGAGYRRYSRSNDLNSWDYDGSLSYTVPLSRRISLQVSDQFTSSYNDSWSFLSLYSPLNYYPDFSNEVLFNRQRINRNSLTGNLSYRPTRKLAVGLFGAYRYYDYSKNTLGNQNAYEAGGSLSYEIVKWLSFSSRYSAYLNDVDERFRDEPIHRLQFGGLDFNLSHSWRMWAGGGIELAEYESRNRIHESMNAGIGYTARQTTFSITYQRSFTSAIGLSEILNSDVIGALLGHRITSWMRGSVQSYYYRSTELETEGLLKTFSAGGGFEFALRRNIVASVNGFYQNQNTHNFSIQGLGINRITGYLGLQYFWPSGSRRNID